MNHRTNACRARPTVLWFRQGGHGRSGLEGQGWRNCALYYYQGQGEGGMDDLASDHGLDVLLMAWGHRQRVRVPVYLPVLSASFDSLLFCCLALWVSLSQVAHACLLPDTHALPMSSHAAARVWRKRDTRSNSSGVTSPSADATSASFSRFLMSRPDMSGSRFTMASIRLFGSSTPF